MTDIPIPMIPKCKICSKIFRTKAGLEDHLQFRHQPGEQYWPGLPSMYRELMDKLDLILEHLKARS